MKTHEHRTLAPLLALLLGAFLTAPTLAAMSEPAAGASPSTSSSPAQSPAVPQAQSSEQPMIDKAKESCVLYDKNHDGYLSSSEFKDTRKAGSAFRTADANGDGRLDEKECTKVLSTS